jgi:molybdopterin-guanine dinucleotide biosynthesis protein A
VTDTGANRAFAPGAIKPAVNSLRTLVDEPRRQDITGVVLAGGHARRMGQRDKGLVELAGKPLVAHVIAALRPQVGDLLISANRNIEHYAEFGYPVLRDAETGFLGPLAGIVTSMRRVRTPWLLCAPCDMPLLPADLGSRLRQCVGNFAKPGCAATTHERTQPLCALLHRDLADTIEQFLANGRRSALDWIRLAGLEWCDFSDETHCFLNLNTPAEVSRFEAQLNDNGQNE